MRIFYMPSVFRFHMSISLYHMTALTFVLSENTVGQGHCCILYVYCREGTGVDVRTLTEVLCQ
jgi:hypothetical protein